MIHNYINANEKNYFKRNSRRSKKFIMMINESFLLMLGFRKKFLDQCKKQGND